MFLLFWCDTMLTQWHSNLTHWSSWLQCTVICCCKLWWVTFTRNLFFWPNGLLSQRKHLHLQTYHCCTIVNEDVDSFSLTFFHLIFFFKCVVRHVFFLCATYVMRVIMTAEKITYLGGSRSLRRRFSSSSEILSRWKQTTVQHLTNAITVLSW